MYVLSSFQKLASEATLEACCFLDLTDSLQLIMASHHSCWSLRARAAPGSQYSVLEQDARNGRIRASRNLGSKSPGKEGLAGWPTDLLRHFKFSLWTKMRHLAVGVVYKSFSLVSVSEFSKLGNSESWRLALFPTKKEMWDCF